MTSINWWQRAILRKAARIMVAKKLYLQFKGTERNMSATFYQEVSKEVVSHDCVKSE